MYPGSTLAGHRRQTLRMPTSYNGWPASPDLPLRPLVVAGEAFVPGVLDNDDVHTVLQYVAEQMHERVERIWAPGWHDMDDWGFNYRPTRGEDSMSCHASGTAIDYNATRHPRLIATSETFTPAQIAEIRKIVVEAGVVRWGGEWDNVPDAMHFEIMGTRGEVAAAAARLRQKDWFDMATEADLRRIVREEINQPAFLDKVGNHAAKHVWNRRFEVAVTGGAKAKKAASLIVKETWAALRSTK